jgi:hypothetical protein
MMSQKRFSILRKIGRIAADVALLLAVLATANLVSRLVFPDPFPVQVGHWYNADQTAELIAADNHRTWVFWPTVIVIYVAIAVWRNRGPWHRRAHSTATPEDSRGPATANGPW